MEELTSFILDYKELEFKFPSTRLLCKETVHSSYRTLHSLFIPCNTFHEQTNQKALWQRNTGNPAHLLPRLFLLHGWRATQSPGTIKQELKAELLWNIFCYYTHLTKVIPTWKTLRFIHICLHMYTHPKKSYIHTKIYVCIYNLSIRMYK